MPTQFNTLCQEFSLYNAWSVVKEKGSHGGIDGVTIHEFDKEKRKEIPLLAEELRNGKWKPYPYLEIEIPKSKDPTEKRRLGMIAIRDKIVQQTIRAIIEPRYDRIFVGNSYGYRPGKGATKAIRRVLSECKNKKYKYVLRLDIDNFFDTIALSIIEGKIKNQLALLKYFHKYHKNRFPGLLPKMEIMEEGIRNFKSWKKTASYESQDFIQKLMGHEAQVAIHYWDYIRELISDDSVNFIRREHQGAQDLTNSMLNYGYAILYTRVWQALLAARLNPFESIIHARQEGKPTLAFAMIEIFRSQVVDRIVISLIQKGQDLEIRNGLLTDTTRQLLVKSIMERLARYEKYQGEEMKMENIIVRQAKLLAKAFAREEKFKPYVAKW